MLGSESWPYTAASSGARRGRSARGYRNQVLRNLATLHGSGPPEIFSWTELRKLS